MSCCKGDVFQPIVIDCTGAIRPLRTGESLIGVVGSGSVTPGTTDNAVVRADGVTNDTIQGSDVIIDDNGRIGLGVSSPASIIDGEGTSGTTELRLTRVSADTGSPRIRYRKARGTPGSEAAVADGDIIGTFTFNTYRNGAYQGSDSPASCMFFAEVAGTPAGNSVPGDIVFNTTDVGQTANSNAVRISHEAALFVYVSPGGTTPTDLPTNAAGIFAREANAQMFGIEEDGTVWQLTGSGMDDATSQYIVPAVLRLEDTSAPTAPTGAVNVYSNSDDLWVQCDNIVAGTTHTLTTSTECGILSGESHSITLASDHCTIAGGDTNDIEDSSSATIAGGTTNTIDSSNNATITGGINGTINLSASVSICGGSGNTITDTTAATIGGGFGCNIDDSDYAVVLGGFENTITSLVANDSNYSAIVGGRDNDIIDSAFATISGGRTNIIDDDGNYSTIGGGQGNDITDATHSTIIGGQDNAINIGAHWSTVGGRDCVSNSPYGMLSGQGAECRLRGQKGHANGTFLTVGDAQSFEIVLREDTTDATTTELLLDGSSGSLTLVDDSAWVYLAQVVGLRDDGSEAAYYTFTGLVVKDGAAAPTVKTSTKVIVHEDDGTWDCTNDISGSNLRFVVTGAAAKNINWVCTVRGTQVKV